MLNERYGKWTVVDPNDYRDKVLCRCDCGTERMVGRRFLTYGRSKSCGCESGAHLRGKTWNTAALAPEHAIAAVPGARFGRWTVIGDPEPRGKRRVVLCECDCGNQKQVGTDNLLKGTSKSCGCLKRDGARAALAQGEKRAS
jgi:hypothetical protein